MSILGISFRQNFDFDNFFETHLGQRGKPAGEE